MENNIYFISGIDTDAGKSYCTAYLARQLADNGKRVITQKFIQTGNTGHSEDIDLHRKIMGTGMTEEDREGLTMPEIFSYPCSPHLASRIDNRHPRKVRKHQPYTAQLRGDTPPGNTVGHRALQPLPHRGRQDHTGGHDAIHPPLSGEALPRHTVRRGTGNTAQFFIVPVFLCTFAVESFASNV